ncbi:MAG: sugar transferase [Candidatus Omnitrophica bacterium]|nr:sugar transferase [Candidatus Omnitrophota bacterium]
MRIKNQVKFSQLKLIYLSIICIAALLFFEPVCKDRVILAINYIDHSPINHGRLNINYFSQVPPPVQPQRSHAPEPSTLFLLLSGIGAMIVRFAQKSFEKFKRILDCFLAVLGLTITSPILALAGILIKLNSKGPVIYQQERVGKQGEIFKIYKLRTMRLDAEKDIGAVWAKENDPRITSVGRILRKTHIDEIPQLFNVLKGEMSIVGPRPERPEIVRDLKKLIADYEKRLVVRPGITGLAQVYHKYDESIADVRKKIKYDLLYIKRMCWLVEVKILAQTFVVALTGKGAR